MSKKSIIKSQPQAIVFLVDLKWDTDGKRVKLPKQCNVQVSYDMDNDTVGQIHLQAMDEAAEATGFCIKSCRVECITLI